MSEIKKYVGYVRVSTEEQSDSGAGMEAQRNAIQGACASRKWALLEICEDVASGKAFAGRPGLDQAMNIVRTGAADGIIVAKLDRLSRSVIDAAQTMKRAEKEGWNLVALDLGVDFSTAAGAAMAQMTAVFAELERRLIGERTKAALAVRKAQGVRLGRPPVLDPNLVKRIRKEHKKGVSLLQIAGRLNHENVVTAHGGKRWYASTVRKVVLS